MNETHKILNQNERVIWEGGPQFWPYVLEISGTFFFGLFWTALVVIMIATSLSLPWSDQSGNNLESAPLFAILFLSFFLIVGLLLLFGSPIYRLLSYKYTWYTVTDKRIIVQAGIIGRDFAFMDFDKIQSAVVLVGLNDKVFGKDSGDIAFILNSITIPHYGTAGSSLRFYHVTDPYKVFELFKQVSHDIKTDTNYPNAMRPQQNPGYQTEYKPEDTQQT